MYAKLKYSFLIIIVYCYYLFKIYSDNQRIMNTTLCIQKTSMLFNDNIKHIVYIFDVKSQDIELKGLFCPLKDKPTTLQDLEKFIENFENKKDTEFMFDGTNWFVQFNSKESTLSITIGNKKTIVTFYLNDQENLQICKEFKKLI